MSESTPTPRLELFTRLAPSYQLLHERAADTMSARVRWEKALASPSKKHRCARERSNQLQLLCGLDAAHEVPSVCGSELLLATVEAAAAVATSDIFCG